MSQRRRNERERRAKRTAVADIPDRAAAVLQHLLDQANVRMSRDAEVLDAMTERMHVLRRDHQMQVGRVEGGRVKAGTRKCPRIYAWLLNQLQQGNIKNQQLADRYPEDDLRLYRDDAGKFVDDGNGKLSRHGFNRYVRAARKQLGLARKSPSRAT